VNLKEDLEIFLITYNRKDKLKGTLDRLLSEDSPIKDFNIKILDNTSEDGTQELCEEYCSKYSNLVYLRNKINVGISGNIIKTMELASKKWLWTLCDDDNYDWSNWSEIETALNQDYDIVHTTYSEGFRSEEYPYLINEEAFIPTAIYNTKHITPLTMQNAYAMAYTLLPHHAIGCKVINEKGEIFVPQKRTLLQGSTDKLNFIRMPRKGLFHRFDKFQLLAGYVGAYQLIEDETVRHECCDVLCLGHSFRDSMKWFYYDNKGSLYNFAEIFFGVNSRQKWTLIKLYISLYLKDNTYIYRKIKENSRRKINLFCGLIRFSYKKKEIAGDA